MIIYKDKFPLWDIKEKNYKHDLTAVICKYENSQRLTWPVSEIVVKLNPDCIFCYMAPGVSCPVWGYLFPSSQYAISTE